HVVLFFFFSSRRRHTRSKRDWSSDVCSSDLYKEFVGRMETNKVDTKPIIEALKEQGYPQMIQPVLEAIGEQERANKEERRYLKRSEERRVGKEWRSRREREQ